MTTDVKHLVRRFTHTGYVEGVDSRSPKGYRRKVELRETKTLWISRDNQRFSKKRDGLVPGDLPMWRLNLNSIEPISD